MRKAFCRDQGEEEVLQRGNQADKKTKAPVQVQDRQKDGEKYSRNAGEPKASRVPMNETAMNNINVGIEVSKKALKKCKGAGTGRR